MPATVSICQRPCRFAPVCSPRCYIVDGQCLLLATVSYACRRGNVSRIAAHAVSEPLRGPGEKSLSEMLLVQLKGLHRSILRQIPSRRLAQVDIPTDFCPGDVAEAPFSTDRACVICTGRHSVRFLPGGVARARFPSGRALRESHGSMSRTIPRRDASRAVAMRHLEEHMCEIVEYGYRLSHV